MAAEKMRAWVNSWWQAPALPPGLRTAIGMHNAYFREFSGYQRRPYSALPALAGFGKAHGLDHFCVWDMTLLGLYCRAGTQGLLEDTPARTAELRQALREAREMGVWVSPLVNLRLVDRTHPFFTEHGEDWAIRSRHGEPVLESYPVSRNTARWSNNSTRRPARDCARCIRISRPGHSQMVEKQLELGFTALFIDQPFSEDYCFAPDHGHRRGIPVHVGAVEWIGESGRAGAGPRTGRVRDRGRSEPVGCAAYPVMVGLALEPAKLGTVPLYAAALAADVDYRCARSCRPGESRLRAGLPAQHQCACRRRLPAGCAGLRRPRQTALRPAPRHRRGDHAGDISRPPGSARGDTRQIPRWRSTMPARRWASRWATAPPAPPAAAPCSLTLTPEALGERRITRAMLHRQAAPWKNCRCGKADDDLTLETRLDRWEAAVIELRPG